MGSDNVNYAFVKVKDKTEKVLIPITSNKPEIPDYIIDKWQRIVNVTAKILKVPTGLITRLTKENLEIVVASRTKGNPYSNGDKDSLGIGMFCESVAGTRKQLVVQDIHETEYWKNNPHAGLGMNSYIGVPIQWKDGELFGTFCMLNDAANRISEEYKELMTEFKEIIETDLNCTQTNQVLSEKLTAGDIYMRELHHRVKNHFNLLISLINLQSREKTDDIEETLSDLQNRIQAIALVHEKLHKPSDQPELDMSEYIKELCGIIISKIANKKVRISYDIDRISLPTETSVPIGLIFSELVNNSLKYAFKSTDDPQIRISMKMTSDKILGVEYTDNGIGIGQEILQKEAGHLGIKLIRLLTEQLSGTPQVDSDNGFTYKALLTVK